MSRLTKYKFGPLGVNDGGAGNKKVGPKIPVDAAGFDTKIQISEESTADVYIVKQKGARRFKVQHLEDGDTKVCKLVDKSEVYIDQCCNLVILVKMKDKAKLKIECNFIIIDSEQDLVLGWDAIKTFNLMEVKVADSSETKTVAKLSNKKLLFKSDIDLINLDLDFLLLFTI